jgi:O-antigen/teichoic acid export membrane protein
MNMSLSIERIKRWGLKGGMSVLDQGVFSTANFILSVFLARWLPSEQFGAYAIGFTVLIFVYQFYVAFLLDPMGVLGPAHFSDNLKEYFVMHLRSHFMITIVAGFFFIVAAFVWMGNQSLVRQTLFVIGGTLPLLLLPWYLRRVFYILGQPAISLLGSLVYAVSLVVLTIFLRQFNALSSASALLATAIAGLLSGAYLLSVFQLRKLHSPITSFASVMIQNWKFGKWLIVSSILIAFASQVQIWISASLLGLSASGTLRALQVIIQPMMLTITALMALATPVLSLEFSKEDFEGFNRKVILLSISLLILAIIFEVFLLIFNIPIEKIIYGGKFSAYNFLLPMWGVIPLCLAYSSGIQAGLQAAQKPQAFLVAAIFWAPTSLGFGIWLTLRLGILGATWSAIFGYVIFVLTLSILYWLWVYRPLVSL